MTYGEFTKTNYFLFGFALGGIAGILILYWSMQTGIVLDMKKKAVARGAALWQVDLDGNATFKWTEPKQTPEATEK